MAEKLNKDAVYKKAAKPKEKDYTLNDGSGLTLLIKSNGTKRWLFIYRFEGKQNRLGFGTYPNTSLENARRKTEEARMQIANGNNPVIVLNESKIKKLAIKQNEQRIKSGLPIVNSFADVTGRWLESITNKNTIGTLIKKRTGLPLGFFPPLDTNQLTKSNHRKFWMHLGR